MAFLSAATHGVSSSALDVAEADVNVGWARILKEYYWEPTSLIYACYPKDVEKASSYTDGFHVWKGEGDSYGRGLEDCAIVGGVALSMLCDKYAVTKDRSVAEDARKMARGLINLCTVHGVKGFVARGICVEDGKSVCALSSRDQYTHCLHGLWRYWHSPLLDPALKADIVRVVSEVADRMVEQVTEENDWSFQQAVGNGPTRGICKMRFVNPHEGARLAMFYAVAWDISRKEAYRTLWRTYVDEGLESSLRLKTATAEELRKLEGVMPPYTFLQMQTSLEVLYAVAESDDERARVREAMQKPAEMAAVRAKSVLSSSGTCLCSCGELSLAQTMTPDFPYGPTQRKILLDAIAAEPFGSKAGSVRVVHLAAAWWRARVRGVLESSAAEGAFSSVASASVSNVVVRQRWPWSRLVDVSYAVTGVPPGMKIDLDARFALNGEPLDVPDAAFSGEWKDLADGHHRFSVDPERIPGLQGRSVRDGLRVKLSVRRPPPYVIVDLSKSAGEEGQVEVVTEADLLAGRYGSVETNKFGLVGLAWTAVTNDAACKTTKIVFRHVPRGTVDDADGVSISVADDFYMAVFETTYGQVRTAGYASFTPGFRVDNAPAVNGYDLAHLIGANEDYPDDCCVMQFRRKTGLAIDLPTCAQWEYACRAGSSGTTYYDNNLSATAADCVRYAWCASSSPKPASPQEVGLLECNAWGLYDMLGNANEWCTDKSGTTRYRPGGAYYIDWSNSTCSARKTGSVVDADGYKMNGFRLILKCNSQGAVKGDREGH